MTQLVSKVGTLFVLTALASSACGDEPKRKLGGLCSSDGECERGICGGGICIEPRADEDHDGLSNDLEVELHTNPTNPDTDDDGTRDREELDEGFGALDIDGDGVPDVLESATLDQDNDCIPDQYDAQNRVPDAELAGLVDIVCKQAGVCGAGVASLTVVCDAGGDKRIARCDYGAVPDFESVETTCDGLDNDCDGAIDEQADDLDGDGRADCVDDDDDGDDAPDTSDVCPADNDPDQTDTDDDGLGDACDTPQPPVVTATDPRSPSTDPTPTLIGVADPSAPIEIFAAPGCTGVPLATGTSDALGAFAIEVAARPNDEARFVLRSTNSAGLVSACIPSAFAYLHDDTAPDAPELGAIEPTSPSTDDSPRVSGTAEPGSRVELHASAECKGTPLGAGNADDAGAFSVIASVSQNTSTVLHATAIDGAGNRSVCVVLTTYTHDGERPDPPLPHPTPFSPASPSTDVSSPVLRGCANDGAQVDVYTTAGCVGTIDASFTADVEDTDCATGFAFFGLVAATPNATTTFHAQVRGGPESVSACVPLGVFVHDSIAPTAPVFVAANPPSPSSLATPTIVGHAEPGATVSLHVQTSCEDAAIGNGASGPDGAFVIVATLPASESTRIFARATDAVGNTSPCAQLTTYLHDGSVPLAPSPHPTLPFTPPSPSGSDDTPLVRGCAGEADRVSIFDSDGCIGTPLTTLIAAISDDKCPTGFAFSGPVPVVKPASTTIFRGQTGNDADALSACATLGTYVFDAAAPPPPTLVAISPPSPSSMTTPLVVGSAEPGATVTLYRGASCASGVEAGSDRADAAGKWTIIASLEGLDTTTRFHATATDATNNVSTCGALGNWTHDDVAPRAPIMLASQKAAVATPSNIAAPPVRLCSDSGTTVSVFLTPDCSGESASATQVTGSTVCAALIGSEEQRFTLPVSGSATWYGRARDGAGNRSDCASLMSYVFDATPPAAPELLRVRAANWTMRDPATVEKSDLKIAGRSEPGARVTFVIDGASNGTTLADANGRFGGIATAVPVLGPGSVHKLQLRATDVAGNTGQAGLETVVVGSLTVTTTADGAPKPNVKVALHFPDGTLFVSGTTDGSGTYSPRVVAGMGVTVADERDDGLRTIRRLETWMDLMPGDDLPVDLTPPPPTVVKDTALDLRVALPPPVSGATAYLVQSVCGRSERVTDALDEVHLSFDSNCAAPGDNVDVLAMALAPDPASPFGASQILRYAFRSATLVGPESTLVFTDWRGAGGSTLVTAAFGVVNDTESTVSGILVSQQLRGTPPDEFDISQLSPSGEGFSPAMLLLPNTRADMVLPFITELGPWRRIFATIASVPGKEGLLSLSYEIEQGLGTPPASFGTLSVKGDLLPMVSPNLLVPAGPNADRPVVGWYAPTSLERADSASATFEGDHNCAGQCNGTTTDCSEDADCAPDVSCNIFSCDELEWQIAWRPWDAETTIQVPVVPSTLGPIAYWTPSTQAKFGLKSLAWMDLDFIDGWEQAKALGRGVFPFGESFLNDLVPDEAKVLISFLGDN